MLPPPDPNCHEALTFAPYFTIMSSYLDYFDNPNPETEEEYIYTKKILESSKLANTIVDGVRLRSDDDKHAYKRLMKRMDSFRSEKSFKMKFTCFWKRLRSKF